MPTNITILNASGKFDHIFKLLESKAQSSLVEISSYIALPDIDIVISPCSQSYKTNSGILGCVSTPYVVDILLDTEREDLVDIINNELTLVMAHELHHVIRSSVTGKDDTLLQHLVTEGLACHFESELSNQASLTFFNDIKQYAWRDLYQQMLPHLSDTQFDYTIYFGGKDQSKFPNRAGYWVGFNLVVEYIKKHGGCAVTHAHIKAEELGSI
ncbi:DUF2268 domain-containing putative Zn-dependent protease [Pseudoalteromonas sp. BZB3]|uniref:DUF2268 domain-containing putative Zn-dependent protease n=1 Tax=Pseudoalteromonas sp. BZB3 TaxID=3136670 RepID=UPI0032C4668F